LAPARMTPANAATIKATVTEAIAGEDYAKGMRLAQQLIVSTPEFHVSGSVPLTTSNPRPETPRPEAPEQPYKAVVQIFLTGGLDSFQMLVPHSGCTAADMYDQYSSIRGSISIPKESLLQINAAGQVCNKFGVHPNFPFMQQLYNNGDALFVANVGVMTKDVTVDNWNDETVTRLFAHNAMQEEIKRLDPFMDVERTSPLGRLADAVTNDFAVRAVAIDATKEGLTGRINISPDVFTVGRNGVTPFNRYEAIENMTSVLQSLHGQADFGTSVFTESFSKALLGAIEQTDLLNGILATTDVTSTFPNTVIGLRLKVLAQMIKARQDMGVERDFFFVEMGGFDTHSQVENGLRELFIDLNAALEAFVKELRDEQGIWDSVTVIETSDFARTLTPNGGEGTDHGWGGNIFVAGGSIDGGKILGEFPTDLTDDGDLNVGRGRLIPTTPFDSVYRAIAEWFGVPESKLLDVLPNLNSFTARPLFTEQDLYQ